MKREIRQSIDCRAREREPPCKTSAMSCSLAASDDLPTTLFFSFSACGLARSFAFSSFRDALRRNKEELARPETLLPSFWIVITALSCAILRHGDHGHRLAPGRFLPRASLKRRMRKYLSGAFYGRAGLSAHKDDRIRHCNESARSIVQNGRVCSGFGNFFPPNPN